MPDTLSTTFSALADPTRRAILARLARGAATVNELAEPFRISLPAVSRHLKVLESARLIRREREAQWRRCRLTAAPLREAAGWVEQYRVFWEERLDALADFLSRDEATRNPHHAAKRGHAPAVDSEIELRIERELPARPERVFAAFAQRDLLKGWFGPPGFTCPQCEVDLKPGGRWRIGMRSPQGEEHVVSGVYLEVVPNRRLAFTWAWEEHGVRGAETTVTLNFEPAPAGTRLILLQRGFATGQARDAHRGGWTGALEKLEQSLAKQ